MHEWALAESVLSAAQENAEKEHFKTIKEITIRLGELQQIEQDIFEFALKELAKTEGKKLKHVKFHFEQEKSMLQCTRCEHTWGFDEMKKTLGVDESEAIHFIPEIAFVHARCPKCASPDFDIIKGRGVSISSMKGS